MESTDLLRRLICHPSERLGCNGVDEIKAHPFFKGVDWKRIREINAPNIPKLKHASNTSIFDEFPEIDPWLDEEQEVKRGSKKYKKNKVNDVHFIGYTYKRSLENQKMQSIANLFEEIDNTREVAKQVQRQKTIDKIEYDSRSNQQDPISKRVSDKSDIRPEIQRRISEKEARPEIKKDLKKVYQDENNVFKGNKIVNDENYNREDAKNMPYNKQEMAFTPNMQKQLMNHPLTQLKNQDKMTQEQIMAIKEKNHLEQQKQ
jgi:serine/threonine kinase 38